MSALLAATGDGLARLRLDGGRASVSLTHSGSGIQCLAADPVRGGAAYAGLRGQGVWKTSDGGGTWEAADAGRDRHYTWALAVDRSNTDCWFVSASPGPRQAHYGGGADAFVYRWGGAGPWQALDGGLPQPLNSMPYALVFGDELLYAGLADGRLFASEDRGESWQALRVEGDALPLRPRPDER